ncbi:MarR family transcriptional regulator [Streptomyces sp. NPDC046716]|uniref:MarR family winged helix-turn-helix transcriptional regulator n=1 Tax=Streptomyces sp. NPDC046716 TaxID=3157093 RepID=UPI0033EF6D1C
MRWVVRPGKSRAAIQIVRSWAIRFAGPLPHGITASTIEALAALTALWTKASRTSPSQLSALQLQTLLAVRDTPRTNLKALCQQVGASASTASRLCGRLEAAGLLRRVPVPASRREISLMLTPCGTKLLEAVAAQRARALEAVLVRTPTVTCNELVAGLHALAAVLRPGDVHGPG